MARRTKRSVSPHTRTALLDAVGRCRAATVALATEAPIGGEEYKAAQLLQSALDDMAGTLTGNREHFWMVSHSYGGEGHKTP